MTTSSSLAFSRIAELEHSHTRLRREAGEMRHLLEVADEEVAELRMDNAALTSNVKNLESSLSDAGQTQSEFRRVKSLLADEQSSNRSKEQEIQKLEEERKILMQQNKGFSAQLKDQQQQKEQGELNLSILKAALQGHQIRIEEIRQELKLNNEIIHQQNWQLMQLEEKREEFTNLIRDLRLRIKDLESQVELQQEEAARLVKHQSETRNPLSIADELELHASLAVVVESSQQEMDDREETAVMLLSMLKSVEYCLAMVVLAVLALMVLNNWGYDANANIPAYNLWETVDDWCFDYCDLEYKGLPPV